MTLRFNLLWKGKAKDYPGAKTIQEMNNNKMYKGLSKETKKKVEYNMLKNNIITFNKGGL
tara:strand:+ start:4039 stop:4218 length:180 start_codon:yes stop_codon:yes gene_type:complete